MKKVIYEYCNWKFPFSTFKMMVDHGYLSLEEVNQERDGGWINKSRWCMKKNMKTRASPRKFHATIVVDMMFQKLLDFCALLSSNYLQCILLVCVCN